MIRPPPHELWLADKIATAYDALGYVRFDKPMDLNIFAIRSSDPTPNEFNDTIGVLWRDVDGCRRCMAWAGTTDPGLYWLGSERMGNDAGTFILAPGQYRKAWRLGKHKGKYGALVQDHPGAFKGWRDRDRNGRPDMSGPIYSDVEGLNCHKAGEWETNVGAYSAGCMVSQIAYMHDGVLMPLCAAQLCRGVGNTFTATLFTQEQV